MDLIFERGKRSLFFNGKYHEGQIRRIRMAKKCRGEKGLIGIAGILMMMLISCGCSEGKIKEATAATQKGAGANTQSVRGKAEAPAVMQDLSDNPAFFTAADIIPSKPTVRALDELIRPILKKTFRDAKLISETIPPNLQGTGDLIDRVQYVVRQLFYIHEDDMVHKAFLDGGFGTSPRLGSKPSRGAMSFLRSKGGRTVYSLIVRMHEKEQILEVMSYKLGRQDHLM